MTVVWNFKLMYQFIPASAMRCTLWKNILSVWKILT